MKQNQFGWEIGVALLLALMAPFLLWPVEQLLAYPVIIEEVYKAGLVWLVLRALRPARGKASQNRIFWVFVVGLAFGVSESILYLLPTMMTMEWGNWGMRFVTAVPMHVMTMLIQYWGWVIGAGPWGIIPAILGHGWFNQFVR